MVVVERANLMTVMMMAVTDMDADLRFGSRGAQQGESEEGGDKSFHGNIPRSVTFWAMKRPDPWETWIAGPVPPCRVRINPDGCNLP